MITRHLLLIGTDGVGLYMRMQQSSTPSHIFESDFGTKGDFKWVLCKVVADEIGLEEGGHLGVAWAGVVKDHEVDFEGGHEDEDGDDDEAKNPSGPVFCLFALNSSNSINTMLGAGSKGYARL